MDDPLSEAVGREFVTCSFLGPFLSTASLFDVDESSWIASKLGTAVSANSSSDNSLENLSEENKLVITSLQREIEITRTLLHMVFKKME